MTTQSQLGPGREFDLIRRFLSNAPAHDDVLIGAGDDAAVLRDGWIVSTDASVENVHFRRDWLSATEIGYRAAAVALSDMAAMAAQPVAVFTSLVLPAALYGAQATAVMAGVSAAARGHGAALAGGDTTRTDGPLTIDITVIGRSNSPALRSGARAGDELWLTGTLGGAAAALRAWRAGSEPDPTARAAYAQPQPRIKEALWLAERGALHALIDLSDGLASDAAHLAAASGVRIQISSAYLPLHQALPPEPDALRTALTGGDDYELFFAAPAGIVSALQPDFEQRFGIQLSRVGRVLAGAGVEVVTAQGNRLEEELKGYDHFGAEP
jgi:thiamine-monophosphate kinase